MKTKCTLGRLLVGLAFGGILFIQAAYVQAGSTTFSDANWVGMGGLAGVNGTVFAAVADGSGNLYVGGTFTIAGSVFATNIAKWDGTNWSPLGSGLDNTVFALTISSGDL